MEAILHILQKLGNATAEAVTAFLFSDIEEDNGFKAEEQEGEGEAAAPGLETEEQDDDKDPEEQAASQAQDQEYAEMDAAITNDVAGGKQQESQAVEEDGHQHSR